MFFKILENRMVINFVHLLIVAPLLWMIGNDRFPPQYKEYLVYASYVVALYYLYRIFIKDVNEGFNDYQCTSSPDTVCGANVHHIRMLDSSPGYDRPFITIKKGDAVVWSNIGELKHSVTERNLKFNSGYLYPGQTYTVKFDNPGQYDYYCSLHSGWMVGAITVV